jgi:uncharacterized membrane protein YccC
METIKRFLFNFDSFRALLISLLLSLAFVWGFKTSQYELAFAFSAGCMLSFFPNIEGNNTERFWGMLAGLLWGIFCLFIFLNTAHFIFPYQLLPVLLLVFLGAMLSIFGNRGVMVSFGGLFAIVIGHAIIKLNLQSSDALLYVFFGGITYLIIGIFSHIGFQSRNISFLLSEQVLYIHLYMSRVHGVLFDPNPTKSQIGLLKVMVKINSIQELLRSMLMFKRKTGLKKSSKTIQLAIFKDLVDIYELALASPQNGLATDSTFINDKSTLEPFEAFSNQFLAILQTMAKGWLLGKDLNENRINELEETWLACEAAITIYFQKYPPSTSREGALQLRNLLDFNAAQLQKIHSIFERLQHGVLENDTQVYLKFITTQNYSFKTIKESFSKNAPTFRFAIRLCVAFVISILIGHYAQTDYTHWILVTVIVIMRPGYVLTKKRAYYRLSGTVLGVGLAAALSMFTFPTFVWGAAASVSILLGFMFINRNYTLASGFITFSLMSLLHFQNPEIDGLLGKRLLYSFIGVLIVFFVNYTVFPVWEKNNFKLYLKKVLKANLAYFNAMYEIYNYKKDSDDEYRLARKKALVENGNLASAFENLQSEPKSKQSQVNNFYALILLNHTLIGSIASFSTFIQNHQTTDVSEHFEQIKNYIKENLEAALAFLENKKHKVTINYEQVEESFEILHKKYIKINKDRDIELQLGKKTGFTDTRTRLLEGKVVLEQLHAFVQVSENIKYYVGILK